MALSASCSSGVRTVRWMMQMSRRVARPLVTAVTMLAALGGPTATFGQSERMARQSFDRGAELENEAASLLKAGDSRAARKRLEAALQSYRAALKQNPADPDPAVRIGAILKYEKKCDQALPMLVESARLAFGLSKEALATLPSDAAKGRPQLRELLLLIGQCRLANKPDETGFHILEVVGDVEPSVSFLLGRRYLQAERHRPALRHLSAYLSRNNNDLKVRRAVADLQLRLDLLPEASRSYQAVLAQAPNDLNALKNLAVVQFRQSNNRQAISTLKRVLERLPKDVPARFNLAVCLARLGQHREAIVHLKKALAIKPRLVRAWYRLGQSLEALKRPRASLDAYATVIRYKRDHVQAYLASARIHRGAGRLSECVDATRQGLRAVGGDDSSLLHRLGDCLRDMGRPQDALAAHTKASRAAPKDSAIQASLGADLQGLGRLEDAVAAYRRSLSLSKVPLQTVQRALARALGDLGARALGKGQAKQAATVLAEAVELRPSDAVDLANLGLTLLALKKLAEADSALSKARRLEPRNAGIACALARLRLEQGKNADAVRTLSGFTSAKQSCVPHLLGLALLRDGNYQQASQQLRVAVQRNGQDVDLRFALGKALVLAGEFTEATAVLGAFEPDAANGPPREAVAFLQGYAAYRAGEFEQAVGVFGPVRPKLRVDAEIRSAAWVEYGRELYRREAFKEALSAFKRAKRIRPELSIRTNIAAAEYQLGRVKRAYNTWRLLAKKHRRAEIDYNIAIYLDDVREYEKAAYGWYKKYASRLPAGQREEANTLLARKRALFGFEP